MFQSIRDFKTLQVLTIKYISTSNENLKLLLNICISLFSNKVQLFEKQSVNYFVKNLKTREDNRILFSIFYAFSKILRGICTPLQPIKLLIFLCASDNNGYNSKWSDIYLLFLFFLFLFFCFFCFSLKIICDTISELL